MLNLTWRTAALAASASLMLILGGCEGPPPEQAPPPPMPSADASAPPQDLDGGPADAQPPRPYAGGEEPGMAPIPNPEDMNPRERARVYGHRYDQGGPDDYDYRSDYDNEHYRPHAYYGEGRWAQYQPRRHAHWIRAYAPHHHAAHALHLRQHMMGVAPAPQTTPPAAAPHTPPAPSAPAPADATDRLTQLQSKLAGPVAQDSAIAAADDLAQGKPGPVSLSLPTNLLDMLREQADALGLGKAAKRVDIRAKLSGDGYTVTPVDAQIAYPQSGQPLNFTWQVQPVAGAAPGSLKAEVVAELKGYGPTKIVPLLTLEKPVKAPAAAPAASAAKAQTSAMESLNTKLGDIELPGFGKVPGTSVLAVVLLILVVLALITAARNSAERERERRRKARAAAKARFDEQVAAARAAEEHPVKTDEPII